MQRSEIKVLSKHKKEKVDETYQEVLGLLRKYRKALVIRPTGFGKSYMLAHLSREFDYCVYFYPRDVIRTETEEKYKGILNSDRITFLSYQVVELLLIIEIVYLQHMIKVLKSLKSLITIKTKQQLLL